jgi:outer membrane receptor protein involved in Fe transport
MTIKPCLLPLLRCSSRVIALCGVSFAITSLPAQTLAPAPVPANEAATVLSPFEVISDRDTGYAATSSLSGGRLATALDKTPSAISVLTSEFLEDIGAVNVLQALQWTTNGAASGDADVISDGGIGTSQAGISTESRGGVAVRLRGIRDASVTRDFFPLLANVDSFSTERIDISRGPNSVVFGNASTGGVINVSAKRAILGSVQRKATWAVSNYGGYRSTFDLNQPAGKSVAVRLAGVWQKYGGWRDYSSDDIKGIFGTVTARVGRATQLRIQGEHTNRLKSSAVTYLSDGMSNWNGTFTQANLAGSTAAQRTAAGVLAFSATGASAATNVIDFANPGAGAMNWSTANFIQTAGQENAVQLVVPPEIAPEVTAPFLVTQNLALRDGVRRYPIVPAYGYTNNLSSRQLDQTFQNVSAFLEHQFGDRLFVELAVHRQWVDMPFWHGVVNRVRIDLNQTQPSGAPNPKFLQAFVQDQVRAQHDMPEAQEERASAVYLAELPFTRQRIGLIGSRSAQLSRRDTRKLVRINGTRPLLSDPSNALALRNYFDQPANTFPRDLYGRYRYGDIEAAFLSYSNSGGGFKNPSETKSIQLFSSGSWFKSERLHTILGIRRDWFRAEIYDPVYSPTTALFTESFTLNDKLTTRADSPSAGAVYRLTPWLSLFANYSKSFVGPASRFTTVNRTLAPIRKGIGQDYGIKLNLLDGRITGSIGYYNTVELNSRVTLDLPTVTAINDLNRLAGTGDPTVESQASDVQDAEATGWEFDFTANPARNWTLMVNAAIPQSINNGSYNLTRAYVAARRARWLAAQPDQSLLAQLNEMESYLQANEAAQPVLLVRSYTANAFVRYRVDAGLLKNLSVGVGCNAQGRNYIGTKGTTGPRVHTDGYYTASVLLGYKRKFWHALWDFRLNVSNLLDQEDFRIVSYRTTGIPVNYRIDPPREIKLTTSVAF